MPSRIKRLRSGPPASRSSTETFASSVRRLATTLPAEPAPLTVSAEALAPNRVRLNLQNLLAGDLDALVSVRGAEGASPAETIIERQVALPAGGEAQIEVPLAKPLPKGRASLNLEVLAGVTGLRTYRLKAEIERR